MKPRLSDIARNLSVSAATVSLALSGKGRVSNEMVARIKAEANRLGYSPNPMGKALRTGRSQVIGLVLPDVANPLFPRMARSIVMAAEEHDFGVLIADSHDSPAKQNEAMKRLVDLGSDGIVVIPRKGTEVGPQPIPVAVIDALGSAQNVVSADHAGGGAIAIGHLQEAGHRRILCVGETRSSLVQRTRIGGMVGAAAPDAQLSQLWLEDAPDVLGLIRDGATAIATTSDMIALQLLTELGKAGLNLPEDYSLVGFDNLDFAGIISPALTTIGTSEAEIAERAILGLTSLINNGAPVESEVVPMHLVRRETVKQLARRKN
ncbi:LacI family DNA-binding transcriptional regulator [Amaricoccus sp.]|uniref:LacI family DNA-binding transcriptional regulator n=1 Tax=Amaricoccus sp. TaxID=1872485 RepID=UPI002C54914E|nr:LacI family DNA-binding transcriptional regulator [Amaricoccus sp.]HRW15985.1 LacI family DNA-binding transcriptional regulator [Amaricoccus sp.]